MSNSCVYGYTWSGYLNDPVVVRSIVGADITGEVVSCVYEDDGISLDYRLDVDTGEIFLPYLSDSLFKQVGLSRLVADVSPERVCVYLLVEGNDLLRGTCDFYSMNGPSGILDLSPFGLGYSPVFDARGVLGVPDYDKRRSVCGFSYLAMVDDETRYSGADVIFSFIRYMSNKTLPADFIDFWSGYFDRITVADRFSVGIERSVLGSPVEVREGSADSSTELVDEFERVNRVKSARRVFGSKI